MRTNQNETLRDLLARYAPPPAALPSVATAPVAVVATERGTESEGDDASASN